jgi:hypothetical protein
MGVYRSPDGGQTWRRIEIPWPAEYQGKHVRALLVTA